MWYWIALLVGYSLIMGWGFAHGEVPPAKRLCFISGVWMIGGLAISLGTIVAVLGYLIPSYYGWGLVPILTMCAMVMGFYALSVQVLLDKCDRITDDYYRKLRRERKREEERTTFMRKREEERKREAVRQELIRAKDDPAFIAYVFEE